jgi:hypothetical protein
VAVGAKTFYEMVSDESAGTGHKNACLLHGISSFLEMKCGAGIGKIV